MKSATITGLLVTTFAAGVINTSFAQISVVNDLGGGRWKMIDFEQFGQASSCPDPIFFENSIENPLVVKPITFTSTITCLATGIGDGPADPGNKGDINTELFLNATDTIGVDRNVGTVVLSIQGMGDETFELRATDYSGNTRVAAGAGVLYGTTYIGFASRAGIKSIEVLSTSAGPVVVAAVFYQRGKLR